MFVHHIATLDDSSLAKEFYKSQKANQPTHPSVVHEVEEFLNNWNLQNYQNLTKNQFRKRIKEVLHEKNRNELLNWTLSYKKVDFKACENEEFELKSYFKTMNIAQSRLFFKVQNFVTPTIKLNFKSDQKFRAMKFVCSDCIEEDIENSSLPPNSERVQVEISSRKYFGYPDSQEH